MANDLTIREAILDRMMNGYQKPEHIADATLRIQDYLVVLRNFDAVTLKAGWAIVVATHKHRFWPEPAAIVTACRRALDERDARGRSQAAATAESKADQRRRAADDAMYSEVGREARRDGWSRSLWLAVDAAGDIGLVDLNAIRQSAAATRAQAAQLPAVSAETNTSRDAARLSLSPALLSMARRLTQAEREHAARFG